MVQANTMQYQQKQKVQRFALLPDLPLPHLTGVLAIASVKAYLVIGPMLVALNTDPP